MGPDSKKPRRSLENTNSQNRGYGRGRGRGTRRIAFQDRSQASHTTARTESMANSTLSPKIISHPLPPKPHLGTLPPEESGESGDSEMDPVRDAVSSKIEAPTVASIKTSEPLSLAAETVSPVCRGGLAGH